MRKTNAATGGKLLGLYLHIPFCVKKCAYCDFYSVTDASLKADYTAALIRDIKAYGERCSGYTVDTVYIGGGTPTCLGADYLSRILQAVGACFAIAENAEITVECNPESTDQAVLEAMHKHGVNRLSFGVQAAHDTELKRIGRIHDFAQAQAAVQLARRCGFTNISLDLMYGLPDQTQAQFLDSVTQCLTLNPQHLSCYGLKLDPATPMGRENPVLPDDDTQADTYLAMCRLLGRNGFEHYEISNFAKPGFRSRHNFKYWDLSDYLGLGPGAHSFLNGRRFAFARDIRAYISGESIPQDEEEVSDFRRQGEYLMVRLRTSDGADMHDLENRYHVSTAPYEQVFRMLEKHGLAAHEGTRWYLTEQGFLVSNSIINAVVEAGGIMRTTDSQFSHYSFVCDKLTYTQNGGINMRAVITVTGKDRTGIIAKISNTLYEHQVNIIDISQNVMDDVFAMVMLVNIDKCTVDFNTLIDLLDKDGEELGMKIHTMHEDIFDAMHKI